MLRPIAAIKVNRPLKPNTIPTKMPRLGWVRVDRLLVNDDYQRDLNRKSEKLIINIVENYDWRKFKPPIVAELTGEQAGWYELVDGQHTSIGAFMHGGIAEIPALIIEADQLGQRADAFIGHNRDRVAMSPLSLFNAMAVAGDEDAQTILQVCTAAGITIPRCPPHSGEYAVNETCALASLRKLVARRTARDAREVLQLCAKAEEAPLTSSLIKAVDLLLHDKNYADFDRAKVERLMPRIWEFDNEIDQLAYSKGLQRWRAVAAVLYNRVRKRGAA